MSTWSQSPTCYSSNPNELLRGGSPPSQKCGSMSQLSRFTPLITRMYIPTVTIPLCSENEIDTSQENAFASMRTLSRYVLIDNCHRVSMWLILSNPQQFTREEHLSGLPREFTTYTFLHFCMLHIFFYFPPRRMKHMSTVSYLEKHKKIYDSSA